MTLSLCASEFETKEDAEEMQTLPGEFFNKATHKVSPQFWLGEWPARDWVNWGVKGKLGVEVLVVGLKC